MDKLLFGTAGIPIAAKGTSTEEGIAEVRNLGLDSMELEFVRSINITEEKAPVVKKAAQDNNITLTCHAPYYINLNAKEKNKVYASINRITNSAKIANLCGGYSVCFHPGYYLKMDKEKVYENVREAMKKVVSELKEQNNDIWIRPETTGKRSQFGNVDEILELSQEFERVLPCIDWAHLHAKTGEHNTIEEYRETLDKVEKALGREALNNMHMHIEGIEYSDKGERKHLILEESDMNYKDLMRVFKEYKLKGVVTCESPNIEEDAKLLQKTYNQS